MSTDSFTGILSGSRQGGRWRTGSEWGTVEVPGGLTRTLRGVDEDGRPSEKGSISVLDTRVHKCRDRGAGPPEGAREANSSVRVVIPQWGDPK